MYRNNASENQVESANFLGYVTALKSPKFNLTQEESVDCMALAS